MTIRWAVPTLALLVALAPEVAPAQVAVTGKPVILAADPSDFVIQLDVAGPCGSRFFHVPRTNRNFREMVSLALTAYATGSGMTLFQTGCNSDRNIISHGFAGR